MKLGTLHPVSRTHVERGHKINTTSLSIEWDELLSKLNRGDRLKAVYPKYKLPEVEGQMQFADKIFEVQSIENNYLLVSDVETGEYQAIVEELYNSEIYNLWEAEKMTFNCPACGNQVEKPTICTPCQNRIEKDGEPAWDYL